MNTPRDTLPAPPWMPWQPSAHSTGVCICGAIPAFYNQGQLRCPNCVPRTVGRYAFVADDRPTVRVPAAKAERAELEQRLKEIEAQLKSLDAARKHVVRALKELK